MVLHKKAFQNSADSIKDASINHAMIAVNNSVEIKSIQILCQR